MRKFSWKKESDEVQGEGSYIVFRQPTRGQKQRWAAHIQPLLVSIANKGVELQKLVSEHAVLSKLLQEATSKDQTGKLELKLSDLTEEMLEKTKVAQEMQDHFFALIEPLKVRHLLEWNWKVNKFDLLTEKFLSEGMDEEHITDEFLRTAAKSAKYPEDYDDIDAPLPRCAHYVMLALNNSESEFLQASLIEMYSGQAQKKN